MKQFNLIVLALALIGSFAQADSHNLTSDAIGNLLGLSNIEYSYKIASHVTFGFRGTSGKALIWELEHTVRLPYFLSHSDLEFFRVS